VRVKVACSPAAPPPEAKKAAFAPPLPPDAVIVYAPVVGAVKVDIVPAANRVEQLTQAFPVQMSPSRQSELSVQDVAQLVPSGVAPPHP
jgi:hypothetical protein